MWRRKTKPMAVVPSHCLPNADCNAPNKLVTIKFIRDYLMVFTQNVTKAKDSAALIAAMQEIYPKLGDIS